MYGAGGVKRPDALGRWRRGLGRRVAQGLSPLCTQRVPGEEAQSGSGGDRGGRDREPQAPAAQYAVLAAGERPGLEPGQARPRRLHVLRPMRARHHHHQAQPALRVASMTRRARITTRTTSRSTTIDLRVVSEDRSSLFPSGAGIIRAFHLFFLNFGPIRAIGSFLNVNPHLQLLAIEITTVENVEIAMH
jgi:hypothetical protein